MHLDGSSGAPRARTSLRIVALLLACSVASQASPAWSLQTADPAATGALYRAGYEAYNRGDLETAHARFDRLVHLAPAVAVGHAAYGEVLLAQGQVAAALDQLRVARQLDPTAAATILALGHAWLAAGEAGKAADAFRDSVSAGAVLSPEDSRTYAGALAAAGKPDQALAVLESALEPPAAGQPAVPAKETATLEDAVGTLLAQRGNFEQAAQHFTAALAADPSLAGAAAHLGSALLATHQAEAAIAELRRAVALAPNEAPYQIELGRALTASGHDAEAVSVLRQAVALADRSGSAAKLPAASTSRHESATAGPDQAQQNAEQARYALALALQASGQPAEAVPLFAAYVAAQPHDASGLTNYALALVQTGDAKDALPLYQQALKLGPDNATLRQDYGVAYLQQSDLDHAIQEFQAGLALEPENPHLHYDLALAYKLKDNLGAAIPEFERAESLDPSLPDPAYTLGVIHMQQGEFGAAAAELEKVVALQPRNGAAWSVLGNVYKENGETERAAAALKQAIALDPSQPSTHITLAAILAQSGDQAAAAAERKQAAELSRAAVSRQRASFALKSGLALLDQGKLQEAETQLRTAVAADPQNASAHQALAEALTREGQGAGAAIERRQADALAAATGSGAKTIPAVHE